MNEEQVAKQIERELEENGFLPARWPPTEEHGEAFRDVIARVIRPLFDGSCMGHCEVCGKILTHDDDYFQDDDCVRWCVEHGN